MITRIICEYKYDDKMMRLAVVSNNGKDYMQFQVYGCEMDAWFDATYIININEHYAYVMRKLFNDGKV